jgi:hypothetical protein
MLRGLSAAAMSGITQDLGQVAVGQMVGDLVVELAEPEVGNPGQDLALARDRVGQHHVEGRQAIGGDDQQALVIDGVDVADLALVQQFQGRNGVMAHGGGYNEN